MSTTKSKCWLLASRHIAGLALAAGLIPATADATTTLSLDPGTQTVAVGGSFELNLNISGLENLAAPSLGAFDLNVLFDPTLVAFDSFTFGSSLGSLDSSLSGSLIDSVAGTLNLFAASDEAVSFLHDTQASDFSLATLHFTPLAPGIANYGLENIILGDAYGAGFDPDAVRGAEVIITGTQPVPEGGPGLMAALSLGVLMLAQRKLRQQGLRASSAG